MSFCGFFLNEMYFIVFYINLEKIDFTVDVFFILCLNYLIRLLFLLVDRK